MKRLTEVFHGIDWIGVIAFALVAQLMIFAQPVIADPGASGERCEDWRNGAEVIFHFRQNDIIENHVRIILFKTLDMPTPVQNRVSRIIDEAYKWSGQDFGQYIVDLCGKAWIPDEEAAQAEPESP